MSRIGKQDIVIPEKTEVAIEDGMIRVKGPKGELSRPTHTGVSVSIEDTTVSVSPTSDTLFSRALWGTYASHIINMIQGVNEPFVKKLVVEGVGFRAEIKGNELVLAVGFSHPVAFTIPDGLSVNVEKNEITITGIDKDQVGQFAANIRAAKKPEPYKGKGIRYEGEEILRKQGKKAA